MTAHAKLSPSGSSRWMTCPGSVHLEATVKDYSGPSTYAARGTAIHEISERSLKNGTPLEFFIGRSIEGHTITQEDADMAQTYVTFANDTVGTKFFETRVSLEEAIPDCFGTVDMLAMREGHLIVSDLKTGQGRVDAEENTQLMLYALGAYFKYNCLYDFKKVTLVIVQPSLDHFDPWETTVERLMQFKDEVIEAYRRIKEEPTTFVVSNKGCQWCKAIAICPEHQKIAKAVAAKDFADMRKTDLQEALDLIPGLKKFIDAVEEMAKGMCLEGDTIPGWKVVDGRKTREWIDEDKVIARFKQVGREDLMYAEPKLRSPAQMEKAVKGTEIDIEDLITFKTGAPTLAPESDKRPAITPGSRAAKDFASV